MMVLATVFAKLSGNGGIKNFKILPNQKVGGLKPIYSIAMIPLKWSMATKYVTCLNNTADLTKRITGSKPRIFKLVILLAQNSRSSKSWKKMPSIWHNVASSSKSSASRSFTPRRDC